MFLPNYNVSLAETIIPAADLSEQISTAGMEASGTGNMKMALNGALTIGTLDGANVEIKEHVGDDNIFIFGLTAERGRGGARSGIDSTRDASPPRRCCASVLERIGSGVFSPDDRDRYRSLVDVLTHHDYFMVCADFDAYWAAQMRVDRCGATSRAGGARAFSTPRAWAGSRPTARSPNMPRRSGTPRSVRLFEAI